MATTLNALWPTISTRRAAKAAAVISAATTLCGAFFYFLLEQETVAQYGTAALVYPGLLALIAWRTWRLSRAWSFVGVAFVGLMVAAGLFTGPDVGGILGLFTTITGYRGAVAARRLEGD